MRRDGRSACSSLKWEKSGPESHDSTNSGHGRVAALFQLRRERLVVLPAQLAIRLVLDARMRPDEDEPLHELRCLQGQLQAATSAERVPDVGRPAPRLPDERGRLGQARAGVGSRRAAVTGKIRGYDLGVGCELRCDQAPGRTRLSESVNEHDPRRCNLRPCVPRLPRPPALRPTWSHEVLARRPSGVTVAATFSATLVDEWVRAGLTDAVMAPGSRSTPLAVALVRDGRIALHVRLDERSAAFFAVGIGLATGRPAVLVTTSGTAAIEVHAAVVEAHQARVPLIVCTADRPPELHHVGAPQTVEQASLFVGALRWAVDPGVPDEAARSSWRSLGSRLVAEAVAGPMGPGPVHANLAFREPLLTDASDLPPGRRNGRPWHRVNPVRRIPAPGSFDALVALARPSAKGVIVAGAGAGRPETVRQLAAILGWPVLADPRSGARIPGEEGAPTVAAADALLRVEQFAVEHVPEIVLRLGEPWASKVVANWLSSSAESGATHILVDPHWAWRDPGREAEVVVPADPDHVMEALMLRTLTAAGAGAAGVPAAPGAAAPSAAAEWPAGWAKAEALAQKAIDRALASHDEATEPGVARALFAWAPPGSTIVASSSMPVRDPRVVCGATAGPAPRAGESRRQRHRRRRVHDARRRGRVSRNRRPGRRPAR